MVTWRCTKDQKIRSSLSFINNYYSTIIIHMRETQHTARNTEQKRVWTRVQNVLQKPITNRTCNSNSAKYTEKMLIQADSLFFYNFCRFFTISVVLLHVRCSFFAHIYFTSFISWANTDTNTNLRTTFAFYAERKSEII